MMYVVSFSPPAFWSSVSALTSEAPVCTGDKVVGTVFTTDQRGAYVDIGAKGQAFVPMEELSLSKVDRVRRRRNCLWAVPSSSISTGELSVFFSKIQTCRDLRTLLDAVCFRRTEEPHHGCDRYPSS
jgi:hypothetical protein